MIAITTPLTLGSKCVRAFGYHFQLGAGVDRELAGQQTGGRDTQADARRPVGVPLLASAICIAGFAAIFFPLAMRGYQRRVSSRPT
ncbi:hypothetical protein [Amycolatopsis sp. cmx-4-68]|uniref:hypothetical protein n=1 Tax=Amycolatopsis sp. cmx-4-68 TaxID=2790938 RepID=UPI003979303A